MLDLGPLTRQVAGVVAGVRDDQLDAPTPSDVPVATLLDHFVGLTLAFRDAANKSTEHTGAAPNAAAGNLVDDWRERLPRQLEELAEAWRNPQAWEGMTEAGGVTMPADLMARVAVNELVIHGWDLATATGQDYAVDPDSVQASLEFTTLSAEEGAEREGLFGPVVDVPSDASPLDRSLGLAGRRPDWTPPA
jgi:uncharacterized protein (TIGR03086 family)